VAHLTSDIDITPEEFKLFREFIYNELGISLSDYKITLLKSRLSKRLKAHKLRSFKDYYNFLQNDHTGEEIFMFINAVSTNVTSFFREPSQWEFLEKELPNILASKKDKKLRIWSSASSSGEEPYSIIIFLKNHIPDFSSWDIKILATDISQKVLGQAITGEYETDKIHVVSKGMLSSSFDKKGSNYIVKKDLRDKITFRMFNLVNGNYSMFKNQFDIIFCRNVMIYFDKPTREKVVTNLVNVLRPKGYFFIGSSESLNGHKDDITVVSPSIYMKN
jgi:chemotaxis protein methyltransferase CheR